MALDDSRLGLEKKFLDNKSGRIFFKIDWGVTESGSESGKPKMATKPQFDLGSITNSLAQTLFCFPFFCSVFSLLLPVVRSCIHLVKCFIELLQSFLLSTTARGFSVRSWLTRRKYKKWLQRWKEQQHANKQKTITIPDKKEPA